MKGNWKPLVYNGMDLSDKFLISDKGEVYSIKSNKILKQTLNKTTGYYAVCISVGSRKHKKTIKPHIAVACMFVDGRKDGFVVNHIDGDKTNNSFNNLEWVTQKYNMIHAVKNGLISRNRKVKCLNNGMIFETIRDAEMWCGLSKKSCSLYNYFKNSNRKSAGKDPVTGEKLRWELIN